MELKKLVTVIAAVGILGAAGVVYAATITTPADIAAGLTGKTVETLTQEKAAGKTYGTISKEAGKLDEFKVQMLEQKKAILDQRVKEGKLTQAQADEVYQALQENQTTCDGSGSKAVGKKYGVGFGQGRGQGKGMGMMQGSGRGMGQGRGQGFGMAAGKMPSIDSYR